MADDRRMDIVKRDDSDFELTFTDVDGNVINLTNCTVFFTVKRNKTDADANAVISKEITEFEEPTTGIALLQLASSETNIPARSYYFDIQLKDAAGKIMSTYAGRFVVSQDITIRTS